VSDIKRKYQIRIHWIDEGSGRGYYFAYLPDWGYSTVSATASTVQNVISEIEDVKEYMIQYFLATGKPIPSVTKAPFEYSNHTEQHSDKRSDLEVSYSAVNAGVGRELKEAIEHLDYSEDYIVTDALKRFVARFTPEKVKGLIKEILGGECE
jgi:predicted RNase H-like HicB family nuclease